MSQYCENCRLLADICHDLRAKLEEYATSTKQIAEIDELVSTRNDLRAQLADVDAKRDHAEKIATTLNLKLGTAEAKLGRVETLLTVFECRTADGPDVANKLATLLRQALADLPK